MFSLSVVWSSKLTQLICIKNDGVMEHRPGENVFNSGKYLVNRRAFEKYISLMCSIITGTLGFYEELLKRKYEKKSPVMSCHVKSWILSQQQVQFFLDSAGQASLSLKFAPNSSSEPFMIHHHWPLLVKVDYRWHSPGSSFMFVLLVDHRMD